MIQCTPASRDEIAANHGPLQLSFYVQQDP